MDDGHLVLTRSLELEVRAAFALQPRTEGLTGEALIENHYVSLDAGFRNWMDEDAGDDVLPAMAIGAPVMGLTVGRVIDSQHPTLEKGQLVMGRLAWEAYSVAKDDFLIVLEESDVPLHYHLGILGDTGMSAYFGLKDIGQPTAQDTVVISAAGGAVGYVAGQIAKIMGAKRVIGVTSSPAKGERLVAELGYDGFISHRSETLHDDIKSSCPEGIDVYFDNVGGPLLEVILEHINDGARIPFCGAVADYARLAPQGPSNLFQLVTHSAKLEGFMTHLQVERYPEAREQLLSWISQGQLKSVVQEYEGVENCGVAFANLFAGINFGKSVVRVK
ncbi:MAG: NADP-dependent oxidoreductase [Gammaproteobacteria bacterium]|nr:NADP-dependent oxidoreductase [Gammaproteobacteria bacterium]